MFQIIISIFGYASQITQIIGLRINLLLGFVYMVGFGIIGLENTLYVNGVERIIFGIVMLAGFLHWHTDWFKYRYKHTHILYLVVLAVLLYLAMKFTNDKEPLLDTITTTMGVVGTVLVSLRNRFGFAWFFVENGLSALMLFLTQLYPLAIMEVVFCLSNIPAWIIWQYRSVHK